MKETAAKASLLTCIMFIYEDEEDIFGRKFVYYQRTTRRSVLEDRTIQILTRSATLYVPSSDHVVCLLQVPYSLLKDLTQ
jgi:hypothetical protein